MGSVKKIILLLAATSLFFGSFTAFSETIALVTGEFEPLSGEKLPGGGLATMITVKAFEAAGIKTKISFLPWARGYQDALHNKFLGTFPYSKTVEREQEFNYSDPLYSCQISIFSSSRKRIHFQKKEDLKGLTLVVPLGYSMFSLAEMVKNQELKLERTKDLTGAFKMLDSGRGDFVVLMEPVGWREIEKIYGNRQNFRVLEQPLEVATDHFIISKGNPKATEYLAKINKSLVAMKRAGEIDRLVLEFFH